jgi:sulfate/thiosulfate transport system permease protein
MAAWKFRRRGVLPGFRLSFAYTIFVLGLIVIVPLSALLARASELGASGLWRAATDERALAAYKLSFGLSAVAALVNAVFGLLVAWVLARYRFFGRRLVDALVDLPFALPTAVAGIALTSLYAKNGWLGRPLEEIGVRVAFTPIGIALALVFVGLPFVVRTVQPVLEDLDLDLEEAAAVLGAGRAETFLRVIFPVVLPALLTGVSLSFARGLGEYGSVVFISGNMPMKTEVAPLLIVTKLEQYDYAGATGIAAVMLMASFALLFVIHGLEQWARRYEA